MTILAAKLSSKIKVIYISEIILFEWYFYGILGWSPFLEKRNQSVLWSDRWVNSINSYTFINKFID